MVLTGILVACVDVLGEVHRGEAALSYHLAEDEVLRAPLSGSHLLSVDGWHSHAGWRHDRRWRRGNSLQRKVKGHDRYGGEAKKRSSGLPDANSAPSSPAKP